MIEKVCSGCREAKPLNSFSFDKTRKDGYRGRCKACGVKEAAEWYRRNKARYIARYKSWLKTDSGKKSRRNAELKRNPLASRAVHAVNNAIRDGRMVRGVCSVCSTDKNIQAHHDDYSKPLDVVWLCRKHHRELHGKQEWPSLEEKSNKESK